MAGRGKATSANSHSTWLPRGKACLNCRIRKIRCDREVPICGPCLKDGRDVDCEYSSSSPSSTHGLEQKVTELRARLRDLERARIHSESAGPVAESSGAAEGTALSSSSSSETELHLPQTTGRAVGPPKELILSIADTDTLIELFFEQEQPLWFLHRMRFREAVQRPFEDPRRAHTALISVVCAISTRYANPELARLETVLVEFSQSAINDSLNTGGVGYEETVLQLIQARVLLGGALAQMGRTLESLTALEGACGLALALGLHGPKENAAPAPLGVMDPVTQQPLPSPTDNISRAERAGAFWISTTVEAVWAIARGALPRVCFQRYHITTPWPIAPERVEETPFDVVSSMRGPHALGSFLHEGGASSPTPTWSGDNVVELIIASAYLLASASTLARSMPMGDTPSLRALEGRANALTLALGPNLLADVRTLPAQVLVRGITLELHTEPGDTQAVNAARALAVAAPQLLSPSLAPGFLEPAIGMVVPAACRALISAQLTAGTNEDTESTLNTLQGVLQVWAPHSAYISLQLERVQQERTSVL